MELGRVIIFEGRPTHLQRARTSLRLKPGWTFGSGHGPQCGTWAPMSGRTNGNSSRTDVFIVETSLCQLQKKKNWFPSFECGVGVPRLAKDATEGNKKIMMAISNGGVKSRRYFCKENEQQSTVFTYKLTCTSRCAIVSFKTRAFSYLWLPEVQLNVLLLRQILVLNWRRSSTRDFAVLWHQWASLCGASFISDMK